jgi:hypothetical protein
MDQQRIVLVGATRSLDDRSVDIYTIRTFSWENGLCHSRRSGHRWFFRQMRSGNWRVCGVPAAVRREKSCLRGVLLALASGGSDGAAARNNGVNRHTVALCARKFLEFGWEAALGELP